MKKALKKKIINQEKKVLLCAGIAPMATTATAPSATAPTARRCSTTVSTASA